jgi:short-subunit dehydrogenase
MASKYLCQTLTLLGTSMIRPLFFQFFTLFLYATCFANSIEKNPQTLVITCASGELGHATAQLLAQDYNLILTGRDSSKLQMLQAHLKNQYPWTYEICSLDYLNQHSIGEFSQKLIADKRTIAGLVLMTPRPFLGKNLLPEEAEWIHLFQNTFTGPLEVLKAALPHISGKIVIIAGTTSVQLQPDYGSACLIRRMWTTYAKALSHQLGPQGISVNVLSPGVILTNFHEIRIAKKAADNQLTYEEQMRQDTASIPLQRHAEPVEIAKAIKFLLSPDSNFINGVNLIMDGGLTVSYQ